MRRSFLLPSLGLALVVLAACTGARRLTGRLQATQDIIVQAERNGAYRCAPRELALAKANVRFAELELDEGRLSRAEDHYAVAEPNARAAYDLSPPARCAPRGIVVERPNQDRDGDGIFDDRDRCPTVPEDFDGVEDEDGCPEDQDTDGDGIADSRDQCPLEPEDQDGYLDDDGCPELDNDADAIADSTDRCPNDPEDPDGFQDEDGCPDTDNDTDSLVDAQDRCPNEIGPVDNEGCPRRYVGVTITTDHIRINQTIHFEFNRAVIKRDSFPILNTVAQVLTDFPTITIEIQGHTDSRGNDDYNMNLSNERAASVRAYLEGRGIAPSRLTSRGYGETRPIESNTTNAGRAANRRVEFVRTDQAAQQNRQNP
ncbi:MAG: OmpA family protein [Deltaproteobacteria bacterium]|nr:OmpA family protein [Deltaproteobacteria bacterium]